MVEPKVAKISLVILQKSNGRYKGKQAAQRRMERQVIRKLTADWVLACGPQGHVLIARGEVIIDGARILHVGPQSDRPADVTDALGRTLLAPGFIDLNALADVDTTILGFGGRAVPDAKVWGAGYAARAVDLLTTDQMVAGAKAAFCQLLLSGVTTALPVTSLLFRKWAETGEEFAEIAALSQELGLRLVLGPSFRSAVNVIDGKGRPTQVVDEAAGLAGLAGAVGFIERHTGGLVSGLLVPSTIDTCSDDLIIRTAEAAAALDVPFRLHCCQSMAEVRMIWARAGRSPIAHLRSLWAMSDRALLPHAKLLGGPDQSPDLIAQDRAAFAETGATVVHCPLVYGRGGARVRGMAQFRDAGVRIGMGTDTAPPNMLMNLQAGLSMARVDDPDGMRPIDFVNAATLGGAAALGRADLGRIEAGAAADLVAWDMAALEVQPIHDPIEALFLMPPGLRARHVWVAGRHVVQDGQVQGCDEPAMALQVQAIFDTLLASFADRHPQGLPAGVLFPPSVPYA